MNITDKQQLVLAAIKEFPEAVNDDALLFSIIWQKEGWSDDKSLYDNLKYVTRPETIARRRRELHQMGLLNYSESSDQLRKEAFNNEVNNHTEAVSWLYD